MAAMMLSRRRGTRFRTANVEGGARNVLHMGLPSRYPTRDALLYCCDDGEGRG